MPARQIEQTVLSELDALLRDADGLTTLLGLEVEASTSIAKAANAADQLEHGTPTDRIRLLKNLLVHVVLDRESIEIVVRLSALCDPSTGPVLERHSLMVPIKLKRSGHAARLIVRPSIARDAKGADPRVVALLAKASRWFEALKSGTHSSIVSIAEEHDVARADVTRIVYLAFLAPDIVEQLVSGVRPGRISIRRLVELSPLPLAWADQRQALGLDT